MTARDLIDRELGITTGEEENPLATALTTTPARILANNPGGLQITIINLGTDDCYIWTDPTVSTTKGILIAANGGSYEIDYRRFLTLPTREWWAVALSSTTTLAIKRQIII